jgi:hypothetical protein
VGGDFVRASAIRGDYGLTGGGQRCFHLMMKWIGLIVCWLAGGVLGEENEGGEWSVRSYALPPDFFIDVDSRLPSSLWNGSELESRNGEGDNTGGPSKVPPDSAREIDEDKIKSHIKEASKRFREGLSGLPEGTLIAIDYSRSMLAARTTEDGHGLIWTVVEGWLSKLPKMVVMKVTLLELPSNEVVTVMNESVAVADHSALLERLVNEGAQVVATTKLEGKSGQCAVLKMGSEVSHATDFVLRADGSTKEVNREIEQVGLTVEVEPLLSADEKTLDFIMSVQHSSVAGEVRSVPLGALAGKRVEADLQDFVMEKWTTTTALLSGQSRCLGVAQAAEEGKTRLCFLTAFAPKVHEAFTNHDRAASWLRKYGELIEPVTSVMKKEPEVPLGMVKKVFRIPWDLLSLGSVETQDDPFSPTDPFAVPSSKPVSVWKSAKEILVEQGIVFPEGSLANYNKQTSALTVVNEPAMVDLVETFIDTMHYHYPVLLRFDLHVLEAGSSVVGKVMQQSLGVTDHQVAWNTLLNEIKNGRGRLLESAAMETKSGQRAAVESGRNYAWAKTNGKVPVPVLEGKPDKEAVAMVREGSAELVATVEREPLGLRWEVDPVLGADGNTIDLNLSVRRHSREPTERFEAPVAQEGVLSVDAPAVDFHPLELATGFTTQDGMWRMIGTWQPMGPDGKLNPEVMQAVFVRAVVVRIGE